MDKLRRWFIKPKKEVENQLCVEPSEGSHDFHHDDINEGLSSAPQRTVAPHVDLREIFQEDSEQEQEVFYDQPVCGPPQTDPLPPVSPPPQVKVRTGERVRLKRSCDVFRVSPAAIRMSDTCSLPPSPHPGGSRLPCSLPCSPMLRGRHWRSSSSSSSSSLSRLWVEEALQRSKNLRQNEPRPHPPNPVQVSLEGEEEVTTSEEEEEEVTTSEEEEEDSRSLCLDLQTYCQLTPCVCNRCPSAPPFEAELVSDLQTFPLLSLAWSPQRTEGGREHSVPRDGAPQLGERPRLYPCLSSITPVLQDRKQEVDFTYSQLDYKSKETCYHGNNTDSKLMWLSGASGELQTFSYEDLKLIPETLFDCSTCIQRTVFSFERCSFCSNKL